MATLKRNPYDPLRALLIGEAWVRYGKLDYDAWGSLSGVHPATLRRRLESPETLTLDELRKIAAAVGVAGDQLRSVLPL